MLPAHFHRIHTVTGVYRIQDAHVKLGMLVAGAVAATRWGPFFAANRTYKSPPIISGRRPHSGALLTVTQIACKRDNTACNDV